MPNNHLSKSILFGVCTGDSVGLPVQFEDRKDVRARPVTDLQGYGTFGLPPGHWTDDSSLTFCLAETVAEGFDIHKLADKFIAWLSQGYWSSLDQAYDIGRSTFEAISGLKNGISSTEAGGRSERDNGNGSLMRILPLVMHIKDMDIARRYWHTHDVSSITHGHIRAIIACFYDLEYARLLISGWDKFEAYKKLQSYIKPYLLKENVAEEEIDFYNRLLTSDISLLEEDDIRSSGYVVDSMEAAVWCLLTASDYGETILKAVNLGGDTDTIAAISGGLAGIYYGFDDIPEHWLQQIVKKEQIFELAEKMEKEV